MSYRTRKDQIATFVTRFTQRARVRLDREQRDVLLDCLRSAALVGACQERDRTLGIIRVGGYPPEIGTKITGVSVLNMLGYENEP